MPAFLLLACISLAAYGQESATVDPWRVEAAFLRNFARYVSWPESAFIDHTSPWRICVLGDDPFGELLENSLKDRTEQGRPFSVHHPTNKSDLRRCQIVYMAYTISANRRAALAQLDGLPVLTVSNAPGFLQEGGIIRFDVKHYVNMSINLDQARAASLSIQTKMLEVSRDVIRNGRLHKVR